MDRSYDTSLSFMPFIFKIANMDWSDLFQGQVKYL